MRSNKKIGLRVMIDKGRFFFLILTSILSLVVPDIEALSAGTADRDSVQRIEQAYKNISDIKGRFRQISYLKDLDRKETYEGEFFIKIPSLFRWSYKGRSPQEVIISGDRLVIYQKKEKQVFMGKFLPSKYGQTPIALLGGFGNITRDFEIKEEKERLILRPRQEMGNVKTVELWTGEGDFPIKRIRITDSADNIIEIELKDVVINSGLKEKLFEFVPPEGVTVIEGL